MQLACIHNYYVNSLLCYSTAMDYALLNNHEECVEILRGRGGSTISEIKEIAALCIQTAYRGYRYVEEFSMKVWGGGGRGDCSV